MAYTFEQLFAADPANPANIAQNAAVTVFAPGDPTQTPLAITDPSGGPLENPIFVNANGFGSAFAHATLDRVAWVGGGFTGFVTSYEGMKGVAVAAQTAAETAGAEAAAASAAATTAVADTVAELTSTFATLEVVERPQRFYAGHYDTLADVFAARAATNAPAIIELEPSTTYQAANLRVDKPRTSIKGEEATVTLPPGADQDALRIGPDAMFLKIQDLRLAGDYASQTGTSRGLVFEPYTGVDFRYSDRTKIEHVSIDGFKNEGAVIGEKRLHVVFDDVFIRDYGTIGLDMRSSDCRFMNGGLGGIRGQYGVKLNASSNWVQGNGIWSNTVAGVLMTEKANGVKVLNNDIDNNLGGGLRAVGLASDSLDASIIGNHFRGNSTSGDGLHSDIYLEQVSGITLASNRAYAQQGSAARTKYVVDAGAGVDSIRDGGNDFATAYPTLGRWSTTAATARKNRAYAVDLIADGSADVRITRQGVGIQVDNDITSPGTVLGSRLSVTGVGGQGFIQLTEQGLTPGNPAANGSRIFSRDNGSGKTQTCVLYADGSIGVLHTQA
jgi:hypothetical protein